jgi:RNA polymerase sigma factor for flagellar operon FliA
MSAREEQQHLVAYAPLVKRIVRQLNSQVSGAMSREDMEQIGLMGLLEALRRYGAPTPASAASPRCASAARSSTSCAARTGARAPCARTAHRVRDAVRALTRKLGREPTPQEAADALGISQEAYYQHLLDDGAEEMLSFDEVLQEATDRATARPARKNFMVRRSLEQALGACPSASSA